MDASILPTITQIIFRYIDVTRERDRLTSFMRDATRSSGVLLKVVPMKKILFPYS